VLKKFSLKKSTFPKNVGIFCKMLKKARWKKSTFLKNVGTFLQNVEENTLKKSTFPKNVGTKNVGTSADGKERQADGRKRKKFRWIFGGPEFLIHLPEGGRRIIFAF
jgi:hypothetical protein